MELVDDTDGSAFLERELVGLGVDGYRWVRVHDCASGMVPIYTFREYLTHFSNVKSIHFFHCSWYTRLEDLHWQWW